MGSYESPTLKEEGFIHCAKRAQVKGVLERYYKDATNLIVLEIDERKIRSQIKYENTVGGPELFPHIYGPINIDAVLRTHLPQSF